MAFKTYCVCVNDMSCLIIIYQYIFGEQKAWGNYLIKGIKWIQVKLTSQFTLLSDFYLITVHVIVCAHMKRWIYFIDASCRKWKIWKTTNIVHIVLRMQSRHLQPFERPGNNDCGSVSVEGSGWYLTTFWFDNTVIRSHCFGLGVMQAVSGSWQQRARWMLRYWFVAWLLSRPSPGQLSSQCQTKHRRSQEKTRLHICCGC